MIETEWLACAEPVNMLEYVLKGRASERKLRLFACACCRLRYRSMPCDGMVEVIDLAERCADELTTSESKDKMIEQLNNSCTQITQNDEREDLWKYRCLCWENAFFAALAVIDCNTPRNEQVSAGWLRCLFGNPLPRQESRRQSSFVVATSRFLKVAATGLIKLMASSPIRSATLEPATPEPVVPLPVVTLNPSWLTSTVIALAQQMYDSRDFSPMPILADALQDAGCDNEEILNHCRQPGEHVRGCWVVDLLLDRK
jgi:hypothetical protein